MRDFPIFTTEYGVSSLVLKEIPYKKVAYIRIRDVQETFFSEHLKECVSFCRMAGAERIFAAGSSLLETYPLYTSVLEMRGQVRWEEWEIANLFPVTEETVSNWRAVYNKGMAGVDNAATLEARDEKQILSSGGAYFIHRDGALLGVGWLEGNKLLAVVSEKRGSGEIILRTLMSLIDEEQMILEVASTNIRAIRLYEKLGFVKSAELRRWYTVSNVD